jgi:hypothetical protein
MWKVLRDKKAVNDDRKELFRDYMKSVSNACESKGEMMRWITEQNPAFDTKGFDDLMTSIEVERNAFLTVERQLTDLKRAHDNLRLKWPYKWFINDNV